MYDNIASKYANKTWIYFHLKCIEECYLENKFKKAGARFSYPPMLSSRKSTRTSQRRPR